jgi:uncharacterized membrane protein
MPSFGKKSGAMRNFLLYSLLLLFVAAGFAFFTTKVASATEAQQAANIASGIVSVVAVAVGGLLGVRIRDATGWHVISLMSLFFLGATILGFYYAHEYFGTYSWVVDFMTSLSEANGQ